MSITDQTFEQFKAAIHAEGEIRKAAGNTVTIATGLVAYDLQAPAKNLYPVNTPILATLPRVGGGTGKATNWRQITAITGSGYDASGWVPEGVRAGAMSLTEADKLATYVTIGEEEAVTFEAESAARGFEDILATSAMRLLQKMRLKEEHAVLGGNTGVALGTTPTPTTSSSGTGGTLPTLTYDVACVAMTYEGYNNWKAGGSSLVTGLIQTKTVNSQDGSTFTLNGGYAQKSAVATQAVTLGGHLFASVTPVTGAVAYAWFIGAAGASKLERVSTLNSIDFSTPLAGTGQTYASLASTDNSRNTTVPAFDGLLYAAWSASSGAYINTLATGTAGTGTVLTTNGRGGVTEIDLMLQTMWDTYQVSPSVLYVNSQQLKDITNRSLGNTANAPLIRMNDGGQTVNFMAGNVVDTYFNPFATNGGYKIPIRVHPTLPAGTILGWTDNLPIQYQSNNVPNVAEIKTRKDYYQIVWPLVTRSHQTGVYAEEVLAVYFPPAIGIITNVAPG